MQAYQNVFSVSARSIAGTLARRDFIVAKDAHRRDRVIKTTRNRANVGLWEFVYEK
jgi:hypothetical protein